MNGTVANWMIAALRAYKRFVSPLLPAACRYEPTCSVYAVEAIELHGALRGSWLALRRLLRCHPFVRGGFDPVPVPNTPEDTSSSESSRQTHKTCAG